MNLLCAIGIHSRARISSGLVRRYRCRRCRCLWERVFVNLGENSGSYWERLS